MTGLLSTAGEIALLAPRLALERIDVRAGIEIYANRLETVVAGGGEGAAEAARMLIETYGADCLLHIGSAAPLVPYLQQGDLVLAERLLIRNDVSDGGRNDAEQYPMEAAATADPGLIRRVQNAYESIYGGKSNRPELIVGAVLSNDTIVADKKMIASLHRDFGVVAIDREGAVVGRICRELNCTFLAVLTIADDIDAVYADRIDVALKESTPDIQTLIEQVVTVPEMTPVV